MYAFSAYSLSAHVHENSNRVNEVISSVNNKILTVSDGSRSKSQHTFVQFQ